MRNIAILMFAVSILLTGAIAQEYTQTVERDGDSVITKTFDTTLLHSYDINKIAAVCQNSEFSCSVEDGKMSLSINVDEDSRYYEEETEYGLPFITYTLTLRTVPTDMFAEEMNKILVAAGYEEGPDVPAIEIWKRDSEAVSVLRNFGDISYTIYMPGNVVETSIGEMSGSTATFMFSDAYMVEENIVVKSQEINSGYLVLGIMLVVLIIFALPFMKKKPMKTDKAPRKTRRRKKKK